MEEFTAIGKRVPRLDGLEKVMGKAQYTVDITLPRMLHARAKRSTCPHAKLLRIDTAQALRVPGIKAIITANDLPRKRIGFLLKDCTVLVWDKLRYVGEPVAAVAGDNLEAVEEALDLIEVEYEELPAVFDPEEAMKPDCPVVIHGDIKELAKELFFLTPRPDIESPNIISYFKIRRGDVEKGFREADLVMENRYTTARIHHGQIEPHNALAQVDPQGRVTIWSSTQAPYPMRHQISDALDIPVSKIRFIIPYVGGGFGGKIEMRPEPLCVALAQKTGRPVKMVFTREEVFTSTHNRHPFVIYIKDGVKKDGTIIAREMKTILNSGAYGSMGYVVVRNSSLGPAGTYKVPNFKLDGYAVYTNEPVGGAYRGLGCCQSVWPIESQLDMIAHELGIDPVEIRLKNALEEGDENVTGEKMHSVGAKECLRKVAEAIGWGSKLARDMGVWKRGRGIALGNKYSAASASASIVKVEYDGSVEIRTSAPEMGQGVMTILAQIAAEEFGIATEEVRMLMGDTQVTPYDLGAVSSRETYHMGNAVRLACQDAKRQIFDLAAQILDARPEELETKRGEVYMKRSPERKIGIGDIFSPMLGGAKLIEEKGEIIGRGAYNQPFTLLDLETGQGARPVAFYIHGAQATEVEVNIETGQVRVVKFVSAMDVGKAINPLNLEGQIQAAGGMGIGSALFEAMCLDNGNLANPTFMDYKIPTAAEVPMITPIIVEAPHREGPYGAKGIGECVLVPTAPAIANAIYDAVGVRIKDIPITPEMVLKALRASKSGGA